MLPTLLLAAVGLFGALVAWRVNLVGSAAGDANEEALAAARSRSSIMVANAGYVSQSREAWVDYQRNRQRATAYQEAGLVADAFGQRMQAAAHWTLVRPEYVSPSGAAYDSDRQQAALMADAASGADLDPESHAARADSLYDRIDGMTLGGFIAVIGLPFLVLAEISRGRRLIALTVPGGLTLLAGVVLEALSWA